MPGYPGEPRASAALAALGETCLGVCTEPTTRLRGIPTAIAPALQPRCNRTATALHPHRKRTASALQFVNRVLAMERDDKAMPLSPPPPPAQVVRHGQGRWQRAMELIGLAGWRGSTGQPLSPWQVRGVQPGAGGGLHRGVPPLLPRAPHQGLSPHCLHPLPASTSARTLSPPTTRINICPHLVSTHSPHQHLRALPLHLRIFKVRHCSRHVLAGVRAGPLDVPLGAGALARRGRLHRVPHRPALPGNPSYPSSPLLSLVSLIGLPVQVP
jgi:hypothetical protein